MPHLVVADGVEIFYSDHGSGQAFVLLHGWTCDGTDWIWLATDLAVDHRVIVIDQRGHGRSTPTKGPCSPKTLAGDAAAVLRHLEIDSVVAVGHSMGALIASVLAVEYRDLVTALVLADPVYGVPDDTAAALAAALQQQPLEASLEVFGRFYIDTSPPWQRFWHERRIRGMPVTVIAETFVGCYQGADGIGQRSVGETYLVQRHCPMLAVYSATSANRVPFEQALPHGPHDQIVVWDDTGHFLHQEQPEKFVHLTRAWLDGLPRPLPR